jgi:flagella basal body P-ring formation protein FlgA
MRILRVGFLSLAIACNIAAAGPAIAQIRDAAQFTDLTAIDRQVATFTGAEAGAMGGARAPVDRRLRLARCYSPLTLSWHGTRRDTVRVECSDARGWRIFVATSGGSVPVQQQAAVKRGEQVSLTIRGRGFSITRTGEAIEEGAVGEWIKVRPINGGEPLRGRVARPGLVEIPIG